MKKRREATSGSTLNAKQMAELYANKSDMSTETKLHQKFSASFIDVAITVYDRMLKVRSIKDILLDADNSPVNPFDCHTKLQTIISKSGSTELIEWTVCAIWDMWNQ
eukprot:4906810-Pyramimonas_sp.AAC.1